MPRLAALFLAFARVGATTFGMAMLQEIRRVALARTELLVRIEKRDGQESPYVGFLHGVDETTEKNIRFVKDNLGINSNNL